MTAQLLLNEIRTLYDNRKTGVLTLSKAEKRVDVFFRDGLIQAGSSNLESHRLGDYLVRSGYLEAGDVQLVLAYANKHRILFGDAAVRRKLLEAVDLAVVVQRQCVELMEQVFQDGFSSKGFTPSIRSFYVPAQMHFGQLLLEMSRNSAIPFEGDPYLLIRLVEDQDLSQLSWCPEEVAVLSELTSTVSVAALVNSTGLKESSIRKILGVFNVLGIIKPIAILDELDADEPVDADGRTGASKGSSAVIKRSSFPFEAIIPVVTNAVISEKLEVLTNSASFVSEQFKTLKVRIRDTEFPPKVITISSAEHHDGKSLVSVNLALSFSKEPGRRAIIIDCDLRNPTLHKYLGVAEEPGLLQYLSIGHISPHCYMRRLENLYFMTAGGVAENPIELLSLSKMKNLIEFLRTDFDAIILDAPPYSPVADPRIITGLSDKFIMVVRRGKTPYAALQQAFKVLDRQKLLGIVFNDVQPMLFNTSYSHYGYGRYGYGYGNGYGGSAKPRPRSHRKKYLE